MTEVIINMVIILAIFVLGDFVRNKYAPHLSRTFRTGLYVFAIAYFIFVMLFYFNKTEDSTRRIASLIIGVLLIGYFIFMIKTIRSNAG
jgi:uncharacterized membrane protein YoaT (DUF817 family)